MASSRPRLPVVTSAILTLRYLHPILRIQNIVIKSSCWHSVCAPLPTASAPPSLGAAPSPTGRRGGGATSPASAAGRDFCARQLIEYPVPVRTSRGTPRRAISAALIALSWAIAVFGSSPCDAEDADVATLLADAEATYDRWSGPFDFAGYETSLRRAIDLWEEALPLLLAENVEPRVRVLDRLSQAYFELATGYLDEASEREATFEAGKDAALAAIFWYGNNLGQWLDYHHFTALLGGVRDLEASFARAIELDETYGGGGPHRSMAAFLAQAYFAVGRSRADAVVHFERAIELDPTYLENYVNYAEYYARPVRDDVLFDELIATVLEAAEDPDVVAAHPLYNHLAIERARALASDD